MANGNPGAGAVFSIYFPEIKSPDRHPGRL